MLATIDGCDSARLQLSVRRLVVPDPVAADDDADIDRLEVLSAIPQVWRSQRLKRVGRAVCAGMQVANSDLPRPLRQVESMRVLLSLVMRRRNELVVVILDYAAGEPAHVDLEALL